MSKRNNDLFNGFDELQNHEDNIQESRVEETVPSTPFVPSSMEEKKMMQSLAFLEEVQEVFRKTELAKEAAEEHLRELRSVMNGIKDYGEEICKTNSEVRKSLENLNYQISEKSVKKITKQFGLIFDSFLQNYTTRLQEIEDLHINSLTTNYKRISSEEQALLEKKQKEIKKIQGETGVFISEGMFFNLLLLLVASVAFGLVGMKNICSRLPKEDLNTAIYCYCCCLISSCIWWGWKLYSIDRD